tara:strand:+ start:759 stop:1310 length:552 start_codon:yes stop_codon:yes gene_type:complete
MGKQKSIVGIHQEPIKINYAKLTDKILEVYIKHYIGGFPELNKKIQEFSQPNFSEEKYSELAELAQLYLEDSIPRRALPKEKQNVTYAFWELIENLSYKAELEKQENPLKSQTMDVPMWRSMLLVFWNLISATQTPFPLISNYETARDIASKAGLYHTAENIGKRIEFSKQYKEKHCKKDYLF